MTLQKRRELSMAFSKCIANLQQYFDKAAEKDPLAICDYFGFDIAYDDVMPAIISDCLKTVGDDDEESHNFLHLITLDFLIKNEIRALKSYYAAFDRLDGSDRCARYLSIYGIKA